MLREAFPCVDPDTLQHVLDAVDGDVLAAAAFLVDTSKPATRGLDCLPTDILDLVLEGLQYRELATLSATSTTYYQAVLHTLRNIRVYHAQTYTPDTHIVGIVHKLQDIRAINLNKCKEFKSIDKLATALENKQVQNIKLANLLHVR